MSWEPAIIIDSGAFSAFTHKEVITLDAYINFVHLLKKKYPTILYVNLDVIGVAKDSYDNWIEMRRQGLDPIPVYHCTTDVSWLLKYLSLTEYVGLGAVAKMRDSVRMRLLDRAWNCMIDKAKMPTHKVHGMGITSFKLMQRYPWYSVDSSAPMTLAVFGKLFFPRMKDGQWDYVTPPYHVGVSSRTSWKKNRVLHIDNWQKHQRSLFDKYLKETGFKLGSSRKVNDKWEVIEHGLENSSQLRILFNGLFMAKYVSRLEYPRPFLGSKVQGLLT